MVQNAVRRGEIRSKCTKTLSEILMLAGVCVCVWGGGGFWSKFIAAEGARECTYTSRELSERVIAGVNFTNKTRLGGYMLPSSALDSKLWCCWVFLQNFHLCFLNSLLKDLVLLWIFYILYLEQVRNGQDLRTFQHQGLFFCFVLFCFFGGWG